ncbi:MAG: DNA cytosine methyltransferase [Sedimentisphaerales bacterium]|nr:DNA cytosine methyltransferase [Sedimentisphaerales bacterium]
MSTTKNIISLFSGALGLDLGLEKAGLVLKAAVECDQFAVQTIKNNLKHLKNKRPVIIDRPLTLKNVGEICEEILQKTKLKKDGRYILVGGPPCQPFSTAGKRASLKDTRSCGFNIFLKAIRTLRPKFFVIENVKGILSAAKKHRPLAKRGPGFPPLSPDEEHGSAFQKILNDLKKICDDFGYCVSWGVLNSADHGAPQTRERVIFIGSLDGHFVWPGPTHSKYGENGKKKWTTLKDGLKGLKEKQPKYLEFNNRVCNYLNLIPEGNNWRSLPKKLRSSAIGSAYKSWGGRSGFLRRLSWDRPSPTVTNNPKTKATMLCHPTEIRPLSVRECARLQQFPDYWGFVGSIAAQYRQVGNATPLALGHAIGAAIRKAARKKVRGLYRHKLYCADPQLLKRIIGRPKTMLNPPRMRKNKSAEQATKWLNGSANKRTFFKRYQAISAA